MTLPSFSRIPPPRSGQRAGSTLAATMLVIAALVTFLSAAALYTSQTGRYAGRQEGNYDMMAAGDAALEYAYAQWKSTVSTAILGSTGTAPVSSAFPSATTLANNLNSTSMPYNAAGITFSTLSLTLTDQNGVADTTSTTATGSPTANVPGYPGWSGQTYNYKATVTVTNTAGTSHFGFSSSERPTLTAYRFFQVTRVPLFQAAIFYENKLEIHPGAAMTVSGLVHSNGDIWARGFSTLQFKSNVSYVGKYNEIGDATITKGWDGNNGGYIPGVGVFAGVPAVTWGDGTGNNGTKATLLNQVSPIDPFGGASTSNNGLHDIVEVPAAGNTSNQIAYNNASLRIIINSSLPASNTGRVTITDGSGNALSATDKAAVNAAINNGTTSQIYDQREASYITLTTVDMSKLATATVASGSGAATPLQSNFSGTVYIHDISTATTTEAAIRLTNGRNLGQNVTVASDNAVYIQGDYNTGGTGPLSVPSNVANVDGSATPQATGYTRYASAVMADAVTILSNNWVDSNSSLALAARQATPTTVNTAILAGDVPSNLNGNQQASGGAHNFPRFLENWNNINFTYWGSLVEAYRSEEFTGLWQTGNVYYWPNREWNFDVNFLNRQPPGVPSGIQYSRGRWQRD